MATENDKTAGRIENAASKAQAPAAGGVVGAVKEAAHDVAAGASRLVDKTGATAQEWASSVGSAAGQARDRARAVAAGAAEKVSDAGEDLTAFIRRHPLEAVLIGFAVGVGAGLLAAQVTRHH